MQQQTVIFLLLYLQCISSLTNGFSIMRHPSPPLKLSTTILQMGFFDNLLKDAFSNDPNLSSDKVSGAIDEGSEDNNWLDTASSDTEKTDVQKRWLESQQRAAMNSRQSSSSSGGGVLANTNVGNVAGRVVGAPLSSELLSDTRWILSFYLTGVPDRDPSNDLFGSRTNVSVRDRRLGLGASLPSEPTGSVIVRLLGDGSVTIEDSWFGDRSDSNGNEDDGTTTTTERQGICPNETSGQWLLSEDGRTLRVGLPIIGYKRTVTTKGTIQKIYWSSEDEKSTQTSTTYSIPEGMVYGDINVGYGTGGVLAMMEERGEIGGTMLPGGLLRVEKRMGLASSKMVPCGRFHGKIIE